MKEFIKNFLDWFRLKPNLHNKKKRPFFSEKEVWMCHLGANIGFELDGKSKDLLRPVLVLKKLSQDTLLILPLSSHHKNGSWYFPSFINGREGRYCFNQMRMVDSKRLKYRIEKVDSNTFDEILSAFYVFLKS